MNEVVAELDGSDFEDSEDDFDGYLDMKSMMKHTRIRDGWSCGGRRRKN